MEPTESLRENGSTLAIIDPPSHLQDHSMIEIEPKDHLDATSRKIRRQSDHLETNLSLRHEV